MKKTEMTALRIDTELKIKLEKIANYYQRSVSEIIYLIVSEKADALHNDILIKESHGIIKKPVFEI